MYTYINTRVYSHVTCTYNYIIIRMYCTCNMYLPTNMIHSVIVSQQTKYEHNHSSNVYHPLVRRQKIIAGESYHRIQNCWHKQEPPPGENWSSHNVTFVLFCQPLKNGCDLYVAKKRKLHHNCISYFIQKLINLSKFIYTF